MNTHSYLPHQEHISDSELTHYADRLLSDEDCALIEAHCERCERCQHAKGEALKVHTLFEIAYPEPLLSEARYQASKVSNWNVISAELQRELRAGRREQSSQERLEGGFSLLLSWLRRRVGSMTLVAMGAALVFLSTTGFKSTLVDFIVSSHEREWPSEVQASELSQVQSWFAKHAEAGVALKIPHFQRAEAPKVSLETARLSLAQIAPKRWERSAHLIYRLPDLGQRITVLAFKGSPEPIEEGQEHRVAGVGVRLIKRGPLNIAHYTRGELSYVLTSDLREPELLKLIKLDLHHGER